MEDLQLDGKPLPQPVSKSTFSAAVSAFRSITHCESVHFSCNSKYQQVKEFEMFLNRALIGFLVLVGVPAYAMTINVPDRAENGAVIPVEINLDKPLTAGQRLDLLVNGELAAQVNVVKGKLNAFSTRVKGSQSNTTITARAIANGSELDSASRNVVVTIAAERMGGSPTSVGDMKVRAQSGDLKMLMISENGFTGTLVVQDAGFRVEIRGSTLISKNPFVGLKGEFSDQVSASIDGRTQQDVVKAQPSQGAGDDPRVVGGSFKP